MHLPFTIDISPDHDVFTLIEGCATGVGHGVGSYCVTVITVRIHLRVFYLASVGITPRHAGTGGKNYLFGITKKGNPYLRSILIHGARAVVSQAKHKDDRLSRWVTELARRKHPNVAAVALANKTVRIAWAMLRNGTDYDPDLAMA
jgi:hypothetical protein